MKFSPAVVACVLVATVPARPVVDAPGSFPDFLDRLGSDIVSGYEDTAKYIDNKLNEAKNYVDTVLEICKWSRNAEKIKEACSRPGNVSITTITDVGRYYDSKHLTCSNVPCCAPEAGTRDKRCLCMQKGGKYDGEPLKTEAKCCSYENNENGVCGCAATGSNLRFGGTKSDCCSGKLENNKCAYQPCSAAGSEPMDGRPCCRFKKEPDATKYFSPHKTQYEGRDVCGCIHAGDFIANDVDGVGPSSCCSGIAQGGKCQCISSSQEELRYGVVESDCCTKHITVTGGKKFCLASECAGPGERVKGGKKCCSGIEKDGMCGCLEPGKTFDKKSGAEQTCCSLTASHADKEKCGHLHAGQTINKTFMDASVCSSGKVGKDGVCECVHDGEVSAEADQCCSGRHSKDGKTCGCSLTGVKLKHGSVVSDCCSGEAERGVCTCNFPGRPSRDDGKDCCTKSAKGGYCGCLGPKVRVTGRTLIQCCGGFFNASDSSCKCIPKLTAVASFVHPGACCGDKPTIVDGRCGNGKK